MRHPLAAVEQTLAQIAGARVFSKLDANSGFWQIPVSRVSFAHDLHNNIWSILF